MNLLAIETSADFCSIAASRGETVVSRHEPAQQRQAEMILEMVDAVLAEARIAIEDLSGIAYGAGPGSFTGLRVACGVTQGLALARGIGVVGIGTLLVLAEQAAEQAAEEAAEEAAGKAADEFSGDRIIACLDAHMGEVYHAAYRKSGAGWEEILAPGVFKPESVPAVTGEGWTGCGSGFAAHGERILVRHAGRLRTVRPGIAPTARALLRLALPRFAAGEAMDPATAVPVYLRDKVALKTSERA